MTDTLQQFQQALEIVGHLHLHDTGQVPEDDVAHHLAQIPLDERARLVWPLATVVLAALDEVARVRDVDRAQVLAEFGIAHLGALEAQLHSQDQPDQ